MTDTFTFEPAGRTQYYTAATLDGYIADPDHSLDWLFQFDAGGEGGGPDDWPSFIGAVGAIAMGSHTYEWILRHLEGGAPGLTTDGGWPYGQPTWVFSTRTLPGVEGADIRFVKGDVARVHREMVAAASGKNVWLAGGGELVGQFHDAGLLDDVIVTIAAVTLGAGKPLLPRRVVTPPMRLVALRAVGDAFVQLRYEVRRAEPDE